VHVPRRVMRPGREEPAADRESGRVERRRFPDEARRFDRYGRRGLLRVSSAGDRDAEEQAETRDRTDHRTHPDCGPHLISSHRRAS